MTDRLGTLVIIVVGLLLSAWLVFYASKPLDGRPRETGEDAEAVRCERTVSPSKAGEALLQKRVFAATNPVARVFVRQPDGLIVHAGEAVPPLQEETPHEQLEREAMKTWEAVTRRFSKPLGHSLTEADMSQFRQALEGLPVGRRRESLRYAENVITDDDFALIAQLAVRRDISDDLIDTAFDACLNRSCDASRQAIRKIAQDRSHPRYVDAARIVDIWALSGAH